MRALMTDFRTFILRQFNLAAKKKSDLLTVGVEHEFFLENPDGLPATHEQSQQVMRTFSQLPGWHVHEEEMTELGLTLQRVSFDHGNGRYTALKYDHHPHLLEFAFGYCDDLNRLHDHVASTLELLNEAARLTGTRICRSPRLTRSPEDPLLQSPLKDFVNLRHYRRMILTAKNRTHEMRHFNYAAVIAATQVHVGGTVWWNDPHLMNALYRLEPQILGFAWAPIAEAERQLAKRWEGYAAVFSGYPLIGYPTMEHWDLDQWILAMFHSPLYGGPSDPWAAKTLAENVELTGKDWKWFIKAVRDLQIIRPKVYGSLEFRADPAQPDADSIARQIALRLGLTTFLKNNGPNCRTLQSLPDFKESHQFWWERVNSNCLFVNEDVIDLAEEGLKARGQNELRYLSRNMETSKKVEAA